MKFLNRPLFWSALFFMIGISGGYYFNDYPYYVILVYILFVPLIFYLIDRSNLIIVVVIIIISGFTLMFIREYRFRSQYAVTNWNNKGECRVQGEIIEDLACLTDDYIYLEPEIINGKVVKYGLIQLNKKYIPHNLSNGQVVTMKLILKTPEIAKNPGAFSYRKYLKKKRIYSIGYYNRSKNEDSYCLNYCRTHKAKEILLNFKKELIYLVDISVSRPLNEVIKTLVLGEKEGLPDIWKENFAKAGASHLLAISGLHVGFIIIIFLFVFNSLHIPEVIKAILCTVFMVSYILITGMRASVFRAGLLSIFFLWAPVFARRGDLFNISGLTIIINLLINPYLLFTPGFQLSYLVLFMIIFWAGMIKKNINKVIAVSAAAQLGSIPVTAYYFNLITPVGILTNIWAIPVVAVIVLISIIGLLLGLINPVFSLVSGTLLNQLLQLMKKGIMIMSSLPWGHLELAAPPLQLLIISYIFLFAIPVLIKKYKLPIDRSKRKFSIYLISIFTAISVLFYIFVPMFSNNLQIIFFSVGQGDSIFMRIPKKKYILVDGGDKDAKNYVLSYMQAEGIKSIDIIFITHFDSDHAGGIPAILRQREVDLLVLPAVIPGFKENKLAKKIFELAKREGTDVKFADCGDYIKYNKFNLQILNPAASKRFTDRNNNSLVMKVNFGDFNTLLTGDIEYRGELLLLKNNLDLKSEILKLGHHGSKSSSSISFLRFVQPLIAIISVGENNYGHPDPGVIKRVKKMGIKIFRTDKDGAITINTNGRGYSITSYID